MREFVRGILAFLDKILPLFFWLVIMLGFDKPYIVFISLLSALLHEAGHFAAILIVSGRGRIRTDLSGFRIRLTRGLSYKEERLVYAMGPIFNIVFGIIPVVFFKENEYLLTLGIISLAMGVSNLMPIDSYDGYRIIISFLKEREKHRAERAAEYSSLILTASLCIVSILLFEYIGVGIWAFCLFFISLCSKIKKML